MSPIFGVDSNLKELYFAYHLYDAILQLEALSGNAWSLLWSAAAEGRQDWALVRVAIPPNAELLHFVGTTGSDWDSSMSLDAISPEPLSVAYQQVSCNFQRHTCFWFNAGNYIWQPVGSQATGNQLLEASTEIDEARTFVLETAPFNATTNKGLLLTYQMMGSSSVSVELQSQLEAGIWTTILQQMGDRGNVWHAESVRVPDGTVALRIVANVTALQDIVKLESVLILLDFVDISCSFETDACLWAGEWQLHAGPPSNDLGIPSAGVAGAFHGEWYMLANQARTLELFRVRCVCVFVCFRVMPCRTAHTSIPIQCLQAWLFFPPQLEQLSNLHTTW